MHTIKQERKIKSKRLSLLLQKKRHFQRNRKKTRNYSFLSMHGELVQEIILILMQKKQTNLISNDTFDSILNSLILKTNEFIKTNELLTSFRTYEKNSFLDETKYMFVFTKRGNFVKSRVNVLK